MATVQRWLKGETLPGARKDKMASFLFLGHIPPLDSLQQ